MKATASTILKVCPLTTEQVVELILKIATMLKDPLYTYQEVFARRVIESLLNREGAVVTALWARQVGKTEAVAVLAVVLAIMLPYFAKTFPEDPRFSSFRRGLLIGIYAPILSQSQVAFDRMREITQLESCISVMEDPEIYVGIVTNRGDTLTFSNGSVIRARSASPDSQIEGATHHLVLCEESQDLTRSKVEKSIRPMLASTNGTMVEIGTANESCGGFHSDIQRNIEIHKKGGPQNHFEFNYIIVCKEKRAAYEQDKNAFHLNYEKFIQNEIVKFGGTDSLEFKMNYLCLWQESRVIAINASKFKAAALTTLEAGLRRSSIKQVAGLDVAKTSDSTVLTVATIDLSKPIYDSGSLYGAEESRNVYYEKVIIAWLELQGLFEGDEGQYRRIVDALRMTNVDTLVMDTTGMGNPICERIDAMVGGMITVVPITMSTPQKSNLYKHYLQEMHANRVKYAAGPQTRETPEYRKFEEQHLDLIRVKRAGYVVCEAQDDSKHDDYPDSAALMAWAEKDLVKTDMPTIEVGQVSSMFGGGMPSLDSPYSVSRGGSGSRSRADRYRRI